MPFYNDEIIFKLIQDKEDAMEEFEYMVKEHIEGEIDYYEELLRKFKEDSVGG